MPATLTPFQQLQLRHKRGCCSAKPKHKLLGKRRWGKQFASKHRSQSFKGNPQYDLIGVSHRVAQLRLVTQADLSDINMTPREVVERLDKYIVGQASL